MSDPTKRTDEELMAVVADTQAADRDAAWQTLTARHHRRIRQCLRKRGISDQDAEDLIQQVWVDVHRKAAEFDALRGPFRPWLRSMVRNRMIDLFRASKRQSGPMTSVEVEGLSDSRTEPLRHAIDREAMRWVWETITGDVTERENEVLSMRFTGLSFGEIANVLGITDEAARQTASRVMRQVRRSLTAKGILEG
jgi:RNA polymerase sigma-70 factor (ECF subfamily)